MVSYNSNHYRVCYYPWHVRGVTVTWRGLMHHMGLCHKNRSGYVCNGRGNYEECGRNS